MSKQFKSLSIVVLGICILLSAWLISDSFSIEDQTSSDQPYRYEFISVNDNNIVVFDKQTGEYWRKYIESDEGPAEWEKQEPPMFSAE